MFPRCSTHGLVEGNLAEGANDTGIYVGNDTEVSVVGNRATGNTSGLEVENSSDGEPVKSPRPDRTPGTAAPGSSR